MEGRVVGVEDLGSMEGRAVGVEERAVGVVDRFEGGSGFVAGMVGRGVGVEDLDGFVVGVEDLETVEGGFLDGEGLLMVALEDFMKDDGSLDATFILVVEVVSKVGFSSLGFGEVD